MENFELTRTALPGLTFRGTCLINCVGADPDDATGGRLTNVALYVADDGQFIVSISYRSPLGSEPNEDMVEAANTPLEVEEILSVYSPTDRLDDAVFGRDDAHRRHVAAKLLRRYDKQVYAALEALSRTGTTDSTPDQTVRG